ncbi:MAG: NnrS family protein, partial [Algicola sp.]|nr:NnrS family protein [Algicola sp.]
MQITDLKKEQQIMPLFRLGFRPLFLFGSAFGLVAMALWGLSLQGAIEFDPYGGSYWWHGHEMLFGFVSAIIAGFLLTAVQNWTGMPGLRGRKLVGLFLLWLVARVGLLIPQFAGSVVIAMLDIAFMPVAAYLLAKPLIAVKQTRNLFFVPVMAFFAIANALTHVAVYTADMSYYHYGISAVIFLVTLVMTVVGGRVMPMF